MQDIKLEPLAPQLLESMRSIGYSHESAVADLIDNSITAGASRIDILFPAGKPEYIAVLDDGRGMTEAELIGAMRHGSRSPREERSLHDLGRFGLGLKTASLSQCRRMTVVSRKANQVTACQWSIDHVIETSDWTLQKLDADEIERLPEIGALKHRKNGTLVLWSDLDQIAAGDRGDGSVLSERMDSVRGHLSLVFHRYLSGETGLNQICITINENPIDPLDPFLSAFNVGGQRSPIEEFEIEGHKVAVQAHTLPHVSRLTPEQCRAAGGLEGLRRLQGFYIYRNRRLIVWGTWFRLYRQEELSKLTRVQVDVPNALDHLWGLDIRKAAASPPQIIRERLRALVPKMIEPGRRVQEHRARKLTDPSRESLWERLESRNGSISYHINREHVVIETLLERLEEAEQRRVRGLLMALEESFPGEAFYNDRANERIGARNSAPPEREEQIRLQLYNLATDLLTALNGRRQAKRNLLERLDTVDPFASHPEIAREIAEKLLDV